MDGKPGSPTLNTVVARNASFNFGAKGFSMLSRLMMPPIILSYVSLEEYGIWAACFILIVYLGMSTFGVSNVYVTYIAQYHAKQEFAKINHLLSTGLTVVLAVSFSLLTLLWLGLPTIIEAFHISGPLHQTAATLIFGTALVFSVELSFGAFGFVLQGLQRFGQQTLIWFVSFCLETILIVSLLLADLGIYALLWALVARYAVSTIAYMVVCHRTLPTLSLKFRYIDRESFRLFYRYGTVVQLSGLLGTFLFSIEKLIAGVFIGVKATGLFEIGQKFPIMGALLPSSLNAVLQPAIARLSTLNEKAEVRNLYLRGSRYLNIMTGLFMGFLAAFASPILFGWLGSQTDDYRFAALILTWFTLPFQLNALTGPGTAVHRGVGRPLRETMYPVVQLLFIGITVGLGFFLIGESIQVITVAVAVSMAASALVYIGYTNHVLDVHWGRYLSQVLIPGLVPYGIALILGWMAEPLMGWSLLDRWAVVVSLGGLGLLYLLLSTMVVHLVFLDHEERVFLKEKLFIGLDFISGVLGFRKVFQLSHQVTRPEKVL
jgi:O-antigen/teichoic acid export membrane protein